MIPRLLLEKAKPEESGDAKPATQTGRGSYRKGGSMRRKVLTLACLLLVIGLSTLLTGGAGLQPVGDGALARGSSHVAVQPKQQPNVPAMTPSTHWRQALSRAPTSPPSGVAAGENTTPLAATELPESSLDDQSTAEIERRLRSAIGQATRERGTRIADGLLPQLLDRGSVRVIVAQAGHDRALEPRLQGSRHGPARYFRALPFAALEVGPQALLTLVESDDVTGIEEDEVSRPGLAESVPLIAADTAVAAGHDGDSWAVAVLDTGVEGDHPFFGERLVDEACFSLGGDCPNGETTQYGPGAGVPCTFGCSHGTYVAGAVLGHDASEPLSGVAPAASLISIQVYSRVDDEPGAYTSDLVAALEHVYDLRSFYSIAAVNMSLGGSAYTDQQQCDAANAVRKAAIDLLRSVGIATIVSSGNESHSDKIAAPACISSAISVGAASKSDAVASFSNSASFLSLLAPGVLIRSSMPGDGYGLMSGTSISAPHVAGAWASVLSASPSSSVDAVLFALQSAGTPILDTRNQVTTPRINVMATIDMLANGGGSPDGQPENDGALSTATGDSGGSSCGLVGIELLLPLLLAARLRRCNAAA